MKAYSHDLRERVAASCAEPGAKIYQAAARFSVSLSFIDKLLRRQRTSGSVAELPRHPGPAPRLDAAGDKRLLACLRAQPDATLAEIGQALVAAGGPSLQRTALVRAYSPPRRSFHGRPPPVLLPRLAAPGGLPSAAPRGYRGSLGPADGAKRCHSPVAPAPRPPRDWASSRFRRS